MASTDFAAPDSVTISEFSISSINGDGQAFDLLPFCVEMSIYEDIFFPVVRAEFVMVDGVNLIGNLPIVGEELITFSFSSLNQDITNTYVLHTKNIDIQNPNPQDKLKSYVIHACSPEFVVNSSQYISQAYNSESGDIINQIVTQYLQTDKSVNLPDTTKGIQKVLLARLRPFQAIDMIRKRSVSSQFLSSSYVFFENKQGFNFCSLEYLQSQYPGADETDKVFYYDTAPNTDARNFHARQILSLRNISQVNNTKKLAQGSLNTVVKKFDIITGEVTVIPYNNLEKQSGFQFAADQPNPINTGGFEQTYGSQPSVSLLVPFNSDNPDTFIPESIAPRTSYVSKLGQNMFQAFIYGDSSLTVGNIINIAAPTSVGSTGGDEDFDNRLIAGNHVISKLRHMITCRSAQETVYHCSMELIKGFYDTPIPELDVDDPYN